ncbi:MAG: protein TolR [Geminicoccaceae bacterium]
MALAVHGKKPTGRHRRRRHRPISEINVTPLVDVMLVLLVVFMITAPLLTAGVPVDLPQAKAETITGQDEPLSVTVDGKGRIFLQESELQLEQLAPRLEAITHEKKDTRIFVRGDSAIDYGRVISVVSAITQAGFTKVALLTQPPVAGTAKAGGAS